MGRSIVYCDKCGQLLKEEDFRQGRAFVSDNRNYCSACLPAGSSPVLPQPPVSKVSSTRLPKQPSKESITSTRIPKQPGHESRRIPVQPPAPPPAPAVVEEKGSRGLYAGMAVGLVAVCAIIAMVSGGSKEKGKTEDPATISTTPPTVVTVPPGKTETLTPEDRRREDAARAACVKAYEVLTSRPKDLAAQWRAFEAAVAASQGTSYAGDAETQLGKVRRKFEEERALLETRMQQPLAREQFKSVMEMWEAELQRFDLPEWTRPMNQRIAELKSDFDRRLGVMRETAADAKRRGDVAESNRLRARVAGWGLAGYAEQIDQALAEVVPVKTEPPPGGTGTPTAVDAYRARWKELLAPAAARDFAEALKGMEKLAAETKDEAAKKEAADDLENLRLAASLLQEAGALLPKLAKGQRITLAYWDPGGSLSRIEDSVLKIDAQRVEIKAGESSVVIPFGEVASATLSDLFKGRAAKKESDNRAAAVACFLDGDAEGALRFRGGPSPSINDKYAEGAKELLDRRIADDREKAARSLFYEAERGYFDFGEMAGAIAKYKSLFAEHGSTAFVRRNRAAIAARSEGVKDFLFAHGDLVVASTFKVGKYGRIEAAWVSQQDHDLAKMKDNFIDLEFSAGTEGEYRCWILAGGCCQEVLTAYGQGTELTGPDPANPKEKIAVEPGSASGFLVKPTQYSLKKLHSQHNGPKNPERFDWMQVGSFKYPTAGTKRIRILTNQKGFAVAAAAVLVSRPGPPRDSDFRELEKWRAETPGASLKQGGFAQGSILREVFKDINGTGMADLMNHPTFKDDQPAERGLINAFEGPQDWADNYGTRIRGYVHPPQSGAYVFWLASDDNGELWLSSDEDPRNRQKIAFVPDHCSPREYTKHASQQSRPIELKTGRRYYIEALQKEGGGSDHISVKWKLPTGPEEMPIPGSRLSPFVPAKK